MDTANDVSQSSLVTEVRVNTIKYVIGGFSLVAALGWNEAIKATMRKYYPNDEGDDSLKAKYSYALIVTILLVLFIAFVSWRGYNVDQQTVTASTKKGLSS